MNAVLAGVAAYVLIQFLIGLWVARRISAEADFIDAGRTIYVPSFRDTDSIFVVWSGQVALSLKVRAGEDLTLARLSPGGVFGGLPLIANMPNLETAIAVSETRLLEISHGSFSFARLAKPILAQRLTQVVARGYAQRVGQLLNLLASRGPLDL